MLRKGQRERLQRLGQRQFHGFFVSFRLFFPLVCVIMCKVEEKQLEAALSGDGGGRGRNENTSGLFKLLLASPCPESSAGPRGRLRFFISRLIRWTRLGAELCRRGQRRAGFVCKASQKKEMEVFSVFGRHVSPDSPPKKIFCIW